MDSCNNKYEVPDYLVERVLSFLLDVEFYILGEQEHKRVLITPEQRQSQSEIMQDISSIRHEFKRIAKELTNG